MEGNGRGFGGLFGFNLRQAARVLRLWKRRTPRGQGMLCPAQASARRSRRALFDPFLHSQGKLFETTADQARGFARSSGVRRWGRKRPGLGVTKVRPFRSNPLKSLKTAMGKPCHKLA